MNHIKILRIFGTIYLWIFVVKVLQVRGGQYRTDKDAKYPGIGEDNVVASVMVKPYTLQIFNDNTNELLNERNNAVATPLWQTIDKHFYYKRLPIITVKAKTVDNIHSISNDNKYERNFMTPKGIRFENLNDFDSYKINNEIWPEIQQQQQYQRIKPINDDIQQRRHSLSNILLVDASGSDDDDDGGIGINIDVNKQEPVANIHYKQSGILPIIMEKYLKTKNPKQTTKTIPLATKAKKSESCNLISNNHSNNREDNNDNDNDDANNDDDDNNISMGDVVKRNLFPLSGEETSSSSLNVNIDGDDENGIANINGNGNESLYYADNNELNTNYLMGQSNKDIDKDPVHVKQHMNLKYLIRQNTDKLYDKRAKPSVGHTPFLPAVSGGAMTNLGKFFRDLSKNVHFSEQYQWSAEHQKLLEGDPNFSNIQYHLDKPNAATDQQTAEWIKAIRFYRPSQKIRSLVAMNPHGQWSHSSQFIDPNYMWVGLGK